MFERPGCRSVRRSLCFPYTRTVSSQSKPDRDRVYVSCCINRRNGHVRPHVSGAWWRHASCSCTYAAPSTGFGGASMLEPLFGLLVAIALAIYLLITLLRPERF
ncbi:MULTISPECIES: K(+)-transporting ATPase subunit F [Rhizobium/Agrobacterium group]|uniref:K(+)-transporting ATPase subunit F n=1 Tax=Pararhizobium antarcticum TaxID=1798805 RepID=UPI0011149691